MVAMLLMRCSVATCRAQDDVQARMQEWNKALGVECTHCHLDGQWSLAYLPTFDLAFRMQRMVDDLNAGAAEAVRTASPATPATRAPSRRPKSPRSSGSGTPSATRPRSTATTRWPCRWACSPPRSASAAPTATTRTTGAPTTTRRRPSAAACAGWSAASTSISPASRIPRLGAWPAIRESPNRTVTPPRAGTKQSANHRSEGIRGRQCMNRRQLLTGVLAAPMALGLDLEAQEGAAPDPSLYIPKAHLVEDRAFLHDFMDEYAFVDLVTTSPTLRITHIPTFLERASGRFGTVFGAHFRPEPAARGVGRHAPSRDRLPRAAWLHLARLVRQEGRGPTPGTSRWSTCRAGRG